MEKKKTWGRKRLTLEQFIERARAKHGDKYDYSKVEYKDTHTLVKIICPIHGEFEQQPHNHLMGYGCVMCGVISQRQKLLGSHKTKKESTK